MCQYFISKQERVAKRALPYLLFILVLSGCGGGGVSDDLLSSDYLPIDKPDVSLAISSARVKMNDEISLSWSSSNVSSCVASGGWSGNKSTSGIQTVKVSSGNTRFKITCSGTEGSTSDTVEVVATDPVPGAATVSLSASSTNLPYNGSTTLIWSSTNTSSCTASGGWSGSKATAGSMVIDALTSNTSFSLSCSGAGGAVTDEINITVSNPVQGTPTINLSASPTSLSYNGSTTLTWNTTNTSSCNASGGWSGSKTTSGSMVIDTLTSNTSFSLSCSGAGGTVTDEISIIVSPPAAPVVNFSASPLVVAYDGASELNWSTENTDSCVASGAWSGSQNLSGSNIRRNLIADTTYTLTCTGAGGSASDSVTITVLEAPVPVLSFSASPNTVEQNGSTTLTWNTINANSCNASGGWSGSKATAGSMVIDALTTNTSFSLSCSGVGGTVSDEISIIVSPPVAVPVVNFSASPNTVEQNGSTTLNWSSSNATGCTASGDWAGSKAGTGSQVVSGLTIDSQFDLVCTGPGGSVNSSVSVSVVLNSNGTALLSWMPPTENTDGSQLGDLAGYRIHYGTAPGSYTDVVDIDTPGLSSYLIENLASSTWFFSMTAVNASGIESEFSAEVSKTIE